MCFLISKVRQKSLTSNSELYYNVFIPPSLPITLSEMSVCEGPFRKKRQEERTPQDTRSVPRTSFSTVTSE